MAASQGAGMSKWANLHYATEPCLAGSEHLLLSLKSWVRILAAKASSGASRWSVGKVSSLLSLCPQPVCHYGSPLPR